MHESFRKRDIVKSRLNLITDIFFHSLIIANHYKESRVKSVRLIMLKNRELSVALYDTHAAIVSLKQDSRPPKPSFTSTSDSVACSLRHALLLTMDTARKRHRLPEWQHLKNVVKPIPKRVHSGSQVPILTTKLEGSQARVDILAEADTQEYSHLFTENSNICSIRLRLHTGVQSSITIKERALLEKKGLLQIDINRLNFRISMDWDDVLGIFGTSDSKTQPIKLSRTSCVIEGFTQRNHGDFAVYLTDKSTNRACNDGGPLRTEAICKMFGNHVNTFHFLCLDKKKQYKLYDGQTIALLLNCAERVLLEYLVEAPRRNSTIHTILQGLVPPLN